MKKHDVIYGKVLSRKDLGKIKGGGALPPPHVPGGGPTGSFQCCISGTNNCSSCIPCNEHCTCDAGSVLKPC